MIGTLKRLAKIGLLTLALAALTPAALAQHGGGGHGGGGGGGWHGGGGGGWHGGGGGFHNGFHGGFHGGCCWGGWGWGGWWPGFAFGGWPFYAPYYAPPAYYPPAYYPPPVYGAPPAYGAPPPGYGAAPPAAAHPASFAIYFESGSDQLSVASRAEVEQAASAIHAAGNPHVAVVGHADRSGNSAANLDLSRRRAENVSAALMNDGIPGNTISLAWRGEDDPRLPTADGVAQPENRRVTIVIGAPAPTS